MSGYHHSIEAIVAPNYHVDMVAKIFEDSDHTFQPDCLGEPIVICNGPQTIVYQSYIVGPGEADTFSIVAFYIPHDGNCTVVINHIDGAVLVDNADLEFPPQKEEPQPS